MAHLWHLKKMQRNWSKWWNMAPKPCSCAYSYNINTQYYNSMYMCTVGTYDYLSVKISSPVRSQLWNWLAVANLAVRVTYKCIWCHRMKFSSSIANSSTSIQVQCTFDPLLHDFHVLSKGAVNLHVLVHLHPIQLEELIGTDIVC